MHEGTPNERLDALRHESWILMKMIMHCGKGGPLTMWLYLAAGDERQEQPLLAWREPHLHWTSPFPPAFRGI